MAVAARAKDGGLLVASMTMMVVWLQGFRWRLPVPTVVGLCQLLLQLCVRVYCASLIVVVLSLLLGCCTHYIAS